MVIFGPRGRAYRDPVGRPTGAPGVRRARAKQKRGGAGNEEGEKARRRIEIRIDLRKSSGTRPTFGYSCDRSSLSLFSILLLPPRPFSFSSLALFPFPLLDRTLPATLPPSPDFRHVSLARRGPPRILDPSDFYFRRNP